jgi:hypothetical protein
VSEHGGPRGEKGGFDWEGAEDLTAMSEGELKERLEALVEEGRVVSYRRQVLQRRMDLIRAQLVRRGSVALSPEELARVLMGEEGRP